MSNQKVTEHNAKTGQTFEREMTDEEVKNYEELQDSYSDAFTGDAGAK